ncbi:MAG: hypothetical protein IKB16_05185 [Lentisphaeria bacterium]|nr:hypothetical protein [Lentisphaeria bacterium]
MWKKIRIVALIGTVFLPMSCCRCCCMEDEKAAFYNSVEFQDAMQELAVIAEEREKKSTENQTAGEIQMQPDEKK